MKTTPRVLLCTLTLAYNITLQATPLTREIHELFSRQSTRYSLYAICATYSATKLAKAVRPIIEKFFKESKKIKPDPQLKKQTSSNQEAISLIAETVEGNQAGVQKLVSKYTLIKKALERLSNCYAQQIQALQKATTANTRCLLSAQRHSNEMLDHVQKLCALPKVETVCS